MSIHQAVHPRRIRRFIQVAREDGARMALARARSHLALLARGHVASDVTHQAGGTGALASPRFALGPIWQDLARGRAFHVTGAPAVLRRRRAIAMIGDLNLPQCRKYRVEQMDEVWRAAGADYHYAHYEDLPRCREILQGATHLMLYRLGRSDLATMYLYEARRLKLPVLYDIDDPLFSVAAYETYSNMSALAPEMKAHFLAEAPLYSDLMNMADAMSLSTPGLVAHAEAHAARPAFLRRNFADRATLEAGRAAMAGVRGPRGGVTLALASGSRGHDADLAEITGPLSEFLDRAPDRRLMILGHLEKDLFPAHVRGRIACHPFTDYPTYLARLARADLALMPLTDDPFNACKSAVRVIDAAAAGVASLVSPVGDLSAVIDDGRSGGVVRDGDWTGALDALAADPAGLREMGRRARGQIEARWRAGTALPVVDPELVMWAMG